MKGYILSFGLLSCAFLSGCGGGGGGNTVSPYVGQYQGTFTSSNTADQGTVAFGIDQNGLVTGTLVDDATTPSTTENLDGNIADNGDFVGDLTDSAGKSPFGGNLDFDTAGQLSGPVNITVPGSGVIHATFSLTPVGAALKKGHRPVSTPIRTSRSKAILR